MDLLVRQAEPADAGFVASLLADLGYPVSSEFAAERLAHFESDPASLVQLAEAEGAAARCRGRGATSRLPAS
jgi:hypothetical protein